MASITGRVSKPKIRSLGVHRRQSARRSRITCPLAMASGGYRQTVSKSYRRGRLFPPQRDLEIAAELADEIDGDAGMDAALLVVETRPLADRKHRLMPDAGVDMNAERAVAMEGDEILRRHVVARPGEESDVGRAVARKENLAAIGVVIRLVGEQPRGVARHTRFGGGRGVGEPPGDVAAADGMVDRVLDLAAANP